MAAAVRAGGLVAGIGSIQLAVRVRADAGGVPEGLSPTAVHSAADASATIGSRRLDPHRRVPARGAGHGTRDVSASAVALATREGARVLGLENQTGTLTPGKEADLIVLDLNQPHLTPLYDPFSHLAYAARAADVRHVMARGRWLLYDRRFTTLDWPEIAARLRRDCRGLAALCQKRTRP